MKEATELKAMRDTALIGHALNSISWWLFKKNKTCPDCTPDCKAKTDCEQKRKLAEQKLNAAISKLKTLCEEYIKNYNTVPLRLTTTIVPEGHHEIDLVFEGTTMQLRGYFIDECLYEIVQGLKLKRKMTSLKDAF